MYRIYTCMCENSGPVVVRTCYRPARTIQYDIYNPIHSYLVYLQIGTIHM